jgi:hypothetical protein
MMPLFGTPLPRRRRRMRRLAGLLRGPAMRDRPGQWARRALLWAAGAGAMASAVLYLLLAFHTYRVPYPQLWATTTAALLIPWTLLNLGGASPAGPEPEPAPAERRPRPFALADRWALRLSVTSGDVEWFSRVVRARLVTLTAQRLRLHHGVRLTDEPERARAVLPEDLYEFLTAPLTRTPTPPELDRLITRIEEI